MERYTGPKDKISRRFGVALFGPTKALEHKNYPPGMHGPKGSRRKHSDYSLALAEKQKLRFQYRSEERRVGKECRSGWSPQLVKKKNGRKDQKLHTAVH